MLTNISNFYLNFQFNFCDVFSKCKRAKNVVASATGTRSDLLAFSGSSKSELRKTQQSLAENNSESGRAHSAHGVDCGCAAASQSQSLLGSRRSAYAISESRACVCGECVCPCVCFFGIAAAAAAETLLICCDGCCCCCCSWYQSIIVRLENVDVHLGT